MVAGCEKQTPPTGPKQHVGVHLNRGDPLARWVDFVTNLGLFVCVWTPRA